MKINKNAIGLAKMDLNKDTEIVVRVMKDGTLKSEQLNFFEGVTIDLIKKKFKRVKIE